MIVVADASPLRYLVLIEEAEILPGLYGVVLIPSGLEGVDPTTHSGDSPDWIAEPPGWLQVCAPLGPILGFPATLGAGEQKAIALAEEAHAKVLLLDDWAGRLEAERRHLTIQGNRRSIETEITLR
jgi:predicted nucleic acid-binding protein